MNRCRTCAYPDSKPDLYFDDTGRCSACTSFSTRPFIDWDKRLEDLAILLDKHNGEVMVPSSGGKDSHYQVIKLKEMGAHVTVVTARTCHLTKIGRRNIDNLARMAETFEDIPNMEVRAKLNKLGILLVGDISWPEHAAIFSTPFRYAVELNKPLIMYGENPQNQYGGPQGSEAARKMTRRWTQEYGGFLGLRPSDFVGVEGITAEHMKSYQLPSDEAMESVGVEAHFLGQYLPWDSHHNAKVAADHGMEQKLPALCNYWEHENLDNAQTGIHDHMMLRKYGYGRMTAQLSVDIRNGIIDRQEALEIIDAREHVFPEVYAGVPIGEVLENIGMTRELLDITMDTFTNWDLFPKEKAS